MINYLYLVPELSFFFLITFYMISFFFERNMAFLFFFSLQVCFFVFLYLIYFPVYSFSISGFMFSVSGYTFLMKSVLIVFFSVFLFILYYFFKYNINWKNLIDPRFTSGFFEYSLICFLFIFSSFFFLSVNDMLFLYIFLELQSLCLYVLAAFGFESLRATEASLKYFFFGAQFSGLFLFGWILLYYTTGLSNLVEFFEFFDFFASMMEEVEEITTVFSFEFFVNRYIIGTFAFFFLVFSIVGKLGVFPLHFWIVDVYDGASNVSVFFFSSFPKVVLVSLLLKLHLVFEPLLLSEYFKYFYFFVAVGSIFWGSIANFSQWRIKRFLAFSSIVNMGYILLFFSVMDIDSDFLLGVFLNIVSYLFLVFSFFVLFLNIFFLHRKVENIIGDINEFFLLKNSGVMESYLLGFLMLSFAGVPPLLGFFGKYYLILYLIANVGLTIAFILLFGTFLSSFYYIRIARTMFNFNNGFLLMGRTTGLYFFFVFILFFFQFFFVFFFNSYLTLFQLILGV